MRKSGSYHINKFFANYRRGTVPCRERRHRHQWCVGEVLDTICGIAIDRYNRDCCNAYIANPNWDYDWCPTCVRSLPWNEDARTAWVEKHGIEVPNATDYREWLDTPEGQAVWPIGSMDREIVEAFCIAIISAEEKQAYGN